jgi:hypothetical protein
MSRPEEALHKAVARYLSIALPEPDAWFTTFPLGGGGKARGGKLRDILVIYGGRSYWLELKAPKGRLTPNQIDCHYALTKAGSNVATCKSLADVYGALTVWGIPLSAVPMEVS